MSAVTHGEPKRAHGRVERRMVWVLADPELTASVGSTGAVGRPWPRLAQLCRVERERIVLTTGGVVAKASREVWYYVTSCGPEHADARRLARLIRGHGGSRTARIGCEM